MPDTSLRETQQQATSADPAVGLRAVRSLRLLADRLEAQHVQRARTLGWSWQDIADALGVSRQAAHQRYGRTRGE
jgi:DNA-directed RNA polymerase specialized sigma24 family protein